MEQYEIENRIENIFEKQGFEVEKDGNEFLARKGDAEKKIQAFSSGEYAVEDVKELSKPGYLVFVDRELEEIHGEVENEVSVVGRVEDRGNYDLPSYELIGEVAVISELTVPEQEAVEGIRAHHPRVKTILLKEEPLSGEFRTGGYEKLYGEETETVHKEFGCRYRVDPTKAYFSERLATERKRVADKVKDGENVLVIGAGVGPYPVLIAREAEPGKVVAVEKNPDACGYLEQNIELNSVEETVEAVCGDAREVTPDEKFDRVIVAVPEFSQEFLQLAFKRTKEGGVIHYYRFLEDRDWDSLIHELDQTGEDYELLDKVICGQRGPSVDRVCLDVRKN